MGSIILIFTRNHHITPITSTITMKTVCFLLVVFVAVACAQELDFTMPTDAEMVAACASSLKSAAGEISVNDLAELAPAELLADATVAAILADVEAGNYEAACTKSIAAFKALAG